MFSKKEKNVTLFFAKSENRNDIYGFDEFFEVVKKHRDKIKPLYYEGFNNIQYVIVKKQSVRKNMELFPEKCKEIIDRIVEDRCFHCSGCGCDYLMYMPITYRDVDGCVGKSSECSLCRDLSTPYRNEIREYSQEHGTLKALMKLLNESEIPANNITIWGTEVDKQNNHKKREPER